ncbi:molybdate ABC transporter substrate-binding protein [Pontibacterium granulatum]|uniref:molybdate ABC transporter substrate-binding protein n=1 Tax=Pontibacterium granulatum TaxID=2036029 RepID=UPI00249A0861|nr:molybdate ABC transporter substrate-binding protein [Pontibacterium granulatum]MDI3324440.1 molybdate ABC transporter substrate-binding protein [Pontibacterium granulatum]
MRAVFIILALAGLLNAATVYAGKVTVAVAANFTGVARQLVSLFEQETGHRVKLSYGSTGKLYAQIQHGAPYEVFLSADVARPQRAIKEGLAVHGSNFTYAKGKLVLWSADPALFDQQTGPAFLATESFARLAIANPKTAPYGQAAFQYLRAQGLWQSIKAKVVRGDSIAQTFQFVASGNAPLGFVALSQIKSWQGSAGSLWLPSEQQIAPIEQQAVLLMRGEKNPAARAFLSFLRSDQARAVIQNAGYGVVAGIAKE